MTGDSVHSNELASKRGTRTEGGVLRGLCLFWLVCDDVAPPVSFAVSPDSRKVCVSSSWRPDGTESLITEAQSGLPRRRTLRHRPRRPRGRKLIKDARIGALTGACGDLRRRVRQFPFHPVRPGMWTVYFSGTAHFDKAHDLWMRGRVRVGA